MDYSLHRAISQSHHVLIAPQRCSLAVVRKGISSSTWASSDDWPMRFANPCNRLAVYLMTHLRVADGLDRSRCRRMIVIKGVNHVLGAPKGGRSRSVYSAIVVMARRWRTKKRVALGQTASLCQGETTIGLKRRLVGYRLQRQL